MRAALAAKPPQFFIRVVASPHANTEPLFLQELRRPFHRALDFTLPLAS